MPEHPCPNHNNVRVSRAYGYQSIHARTIITFVFQEHTVTRASMPKPCQNPSFKHIAAIPTCKIPGVTRGAVTLLLVFNSSFQLHSGFCMNSSDFSFRASSTCDCYFFSLFPGRGLGMVWKYCSDTATRRTFCPLISDIHVGSGRCLRQVIAGWAKHRWSACECNDWCTFCFFCFEWFRRIQGTVVVAILWFPAMSDSAGLQCTCRK